MSREIMVALDPFVKDQVSLKKAMNSVRKFAASLDSSIEPIAVVSPDQLQWPTRFDGTWERQFEVAARESLKKVAASAGLKRAGIEIVSQPSHSLKASVSALVDEAELKCPLAIAVITHIRKSSGLRLFGTFATALLARSTIPLLFVNAKGKDVLAYRRLLFATDFSPESESAFQSTLDWARSMQAEVILFHALASVGAEVYASSGVMGGFVNYEAYIRNEEEEATKDAERWMKMASKAGVKARYVLHHAEFRISGAILESSRRLKADLLVVCSKTSGAAAFILGSVTRDLIEGSKLPVLVIPAASLSSDRPKSRTSDKTATKRESMTLRSSS